MINSNQIYKLKKNKIVRILAWPVMTIILLFKRHMFKYTKDSKYILSLKDIYKDNRCFIIGNGNSLKVEDLEKLRGNITFAANRIYKIFGKTDWRPTYYLACDSNFIREDIREIHNLNLENMFLSDVVNKYNWGKNKTWVTFHLWRKFRVSTTVIEGAGFSGNPEKWVGTAHTVTVVGLQFAIHMGFKEIYLLGIDHSYSHVLAGRNIERTAQECSHFYPESDKNMLPFQNIEGMNLSYQLAKEYADKAGVKIYNATRGGKLEIFERVDFDALFQ